MRINALLKAFNRRCVYCGRQVMTGPFIADTGLRASCDHDIPKARGGFEVCRPENEVLACSRCNQVKSDMTGAEFKEFRQTLRFPATYIAYLEHRRAKQLQIAETAPSVVSL